MGLQIGSGDQTRASHFVEEKKEEEEGGKGAGKGRKMGGMCARCGGGIGGGGACVGGKQFQWFPQPGTVRVVDGCTGEELGLFGSLFVSLLGGDRKKKKT